VAVLAGWTTTEVGRQPWTIYGLMRTADSVTPSLTGGAVLASLLAYMAVYLVVFPTGFYLMARLIGKGPAEVTDAVAPIESGLSSAPVRVELHTAGESQ
jgi:cytochrome d ubiquinol oxidase subunit I